LSLANSEAIIDLSRSQTLREQVDALLDDARAELNLALIRQRRLAEATRRLELAHVDGLGEVTMRVDPVLRAWAEQKYGRGCWHDATFRRRIRNDHPELFVQSTPRKLTLRVNGLRDSRGTSAEPSARANPAPAVSSHDAPDARRKARFVVHSSAPTSAMNPDVQTPGGLVTA
jgi:hypothetical protein